MIGLGQVIGVTRGVVERRRRGDRRQLRGLTKKKIVGNTILAIFLCALALALNSAQAQAMTLPGTFNVTERGAATYRIPIAVPPGTAGMVPSLSLDYNSQGGSGITAFGWTLSGLPAIGRCGRTMAQDGVRGAVKYDANDRFCMEGQRLILVGGVYGADGSEYRTEVEGYSKIVAHGVAGNGPAWFEVKTKSGQTMEFGGTTDSRVMVEGKTTARSWAVSKISDIKGNYLTVSYVKNTAWPTYTVDGETYPGDQVYPSRIDYTGNASTGLSPYNSVQFVYDAFHSDPNLLFQAGSRIQRINRLEKIRTYEGANLVGEYRLTYVWSTTPTAFATSQWRLQSIKLCDGGGVCLPSTSFSWTDNPSAQTQVIAAAPLATSSVSLGDFDGDGKTDLFFCTADTNGRCSATNSHVRSSNGDSTFTNGAMNILPIGNSGVFASDFNADGKTDFFVCALDTSRRCQAAQSYLLVSSGSGTFSTTALANTPGANTIPTLGDFNGDGRTDIFFCTGDTNQRCNATVATSVWLSNGNGTFSVGASGLLNVSDSGIYAGDYNGDGKTDLFICRWDTSHRCYTSTSYMRFSNGDGTFGNIVGTDVPVVNSAVHQLDLNGDGMTDNFFCAADTAGRCSNSGQTIRLSKGDGAFLPVSLPMTQSGSYVAFWADISGNGMMDAFACPMDTSRRCSGTVQIWRAGGGANISPSIAGGSLPAGSLSARAGDFNGDGRTDVFLCLADVYGRCIALAGTSYLWTVGGPNLPSADLLSSFTTGFGLTTQITYRPITDDGIYTKGSDGVYPVVDVQTPMHVVTRVDAADGVGGTYSSTYTYEGAKVDLNGRGFLGFRRHKATDLQTGIVQTTNFLQTFPYTGLSALQTKALGIQTLNEIVTSYTATNLGGTRYFVAPSGTVEKNWDLDGSPIPAVTTAYAYDAYGNATTVSVATPDGASKTTANTYANDTVNWWLGRLTGTVVTSTVP